MDTPRGRLIHSVLAGVVESDHVLVCRLVNDKITLIQRRLWPSLVRLALRFEPGQIAQVKEEHTPSGSHISRAAPFPTWVPRDVLEEARGVSELAALVVFGSWVRPSRNEAPPT